MKVPLFAPVEMLTLPGTVMLALLLDRVTLRGLEAAAVNATVHSDVPGAFTVAGEQVRLLS